MAQDGWNREQGSAGCQQSDRGILCANNCGFFGSATTLNMCSKCYNAHIAKTMQTATTSTSTPPSVSSPQVSTTTAAPVSVPVPVTSRRSPPEAASSAMEETPLARTSESLGESSSMPSLMTPSSPFASIAVPGAARTGCSGAASVAAAASGGAVASSAVSSHCSPPRPVNRCGKCSRRVGLTGFKCRCDGVFCAAHRYSDRHECTFDYKTAGRAMIAKANPVVKADKVDRF